jgi:hypothetical protein
MSRAIWFVIGGALAALVSAPVALAGAAASLQAYTGSAGNTQGNLQSGNAAGAAGQSASLPFTGQNLALFVFVALALVVVGLTIRRSAKAQIKQS